MGIKINNPKGNVTLWPEKRDTQHEVDDLFEKREDSPSSQAREIEEEIQTADKQKRQDNKTVADLVKKSNRILVSITSLGFPFDLFPDTVNIEEGRITIITRSFFSSS